MSIKSDYKDYEEHRNRIAGKKTGKFFINQELRYVKPFQIYGNLYYVGGSWVCVHIVDTGEGLLMFDAGNCGAQAVLIQSIWEMGFNPADVKWIILSHGHVDHFGAVIFFKNMFGTKIYMGEPDVKMFREHPVTPMPSLVNGYAEITEEYLQKMKEQEYLRNTIKRDVLE